MDKRAEWDKAIMGLNRLFLDDFRAAKAALLDALENIDEAHAVPGGIVMPVKELTEEELGELRARWHAIWEAEQAETPAPTEQAATPARPAPRRRTAR